MSNRGGTLNNKPVTILSDAGVPECLYTAPKQLRDNRADVIVIDVQYMQGGYFRQQNDRSIR